MRVWLPSRQAEGLADRLPAGVEADVWDGHGEPPGSRGEVELWVLPYELSGTLAALARDLPRLRVLQTLTAGVDAHLPHVPEGVLLCNARGVHDTSTAELAVALILCSLRRVDEAARAQTDGAWGGGEPAQSLADRTVLIVGYGAIGAAVERRLAGFECEVLRVARTSRDGVSPLDALPELLHRADVVVVTVPMTVQTRGMVDKAFLARLRDGALLVNVARGAVVDTGALVAEVSSGRLRAALDVTDPEPLPADHPLWRTPGVLITPHVGGNTSAFQPRVLRLLEQQLRRFAAGDELLNVVTGSY